MTILHAGQIGRGFDKAGKAIARLSETRANSRAGLGADVLVSVGLLSAGVQRTHTDWLAATLMVFSGLLLFTLVEYCFHRWLFHGPVPLMEPGHRKHHANPQGDDSLPFFLPPMILLAVAAALSVVLAASHALLLMGGLAAGYAIYALSHRVIHSTSFRHRLGRRWAAWHHVHHHRPDRNFGVTTPLWDIILGTRHVSRRRRE